MAFALFMQRRRLYDATNAKLKAMVGFQVYNVDGTSRAESRGEKRGIRNAEVQRKAQQRARERESAQFRSRERASERALDLAFSPLDLKASPYLMRK